MSIFNDSYQTTVGSMLVTKQIETNILKAIVSGVVGGLGIADTGLYKPLYITGYNPDDSDIPLFTHPITINNFRFRNEVHNYLCTDLRFYLGKKVNTVDGNPDNLETIKEAIGSRTTEFDFAINRSIMNLIWLNGGIKNIQHNLGFAGVVFSAWLSDIVAKTFALDFKDQTTLAIITSYYYQSLFINDHVIDEDHKQKMAIHTIKVTKAPSEFVFKVFDKIGSMNNIDDYCANVRKVLENVRLDKFNSEVLLNQIRNSWFGINAKEILAVSIEHPPTWCAIVYTALNERTYKNSVIYRIAERHNKQGVGDEFLRNYMSMTKEYMPVRTISREEILSSLDMFES